MIDRTLLGQIGITRLYSTQAFFVRLYGDDTNVFYSTNFSLKYCREKLNLTSHNSPEMNQS